jgi:hypothetical protein
MFSAPLSWRLLGAVLLLILLPRPASSASDLWELRHNFVSSQEVQVYPSGPASLASASMATGRFHGYKLVVLEPGAAAVDEQLPRIVLATPARLQEPGGEEIAALLEKVGLTWTKSGFRFYGRLWNMAEDGFAATFEDPERPGLPLTIWYANSEGSLALYLAGMEPAWTPGFAAFRVGEVELSGSLMTDGTLATAGLTDRRVAWAKRTKNDTKVARGRFDIRIPKEFPAPLAHTYLEACRAAQERTSVWTDTTDVEVERIALTIHSHVEDLLGLVGTADLSLVNPVLGRVHVLLAEGLPQDGGAAVAEATARQLMGSPAATWMGEAAGVHGASAWWGRPLDLWVGHLAGGARRPSLDLVCQESGTGTFLSPHMRGPLRGFWFGHLIETRGSDFVRALWSGDASFGESESAELEAEFQAALEALAVRVQSKLKEERALRERNIAATTWRAGAALVPGPKGAGYGSRSCAASLAELAEVGANSFSLRVYAYQTEDGPLSPGGFHDTGILSSAGDLELASAAAAGHALGLSHMLQPFLLATPWGNVTASQSLNSGERIEQFFAGLTPYTEHYALLAELIGSDIFTAGTGLSNTSQPPSGEPTAAAVLMGDLKEAGWRDQIHGAQQLFHGLVTYVASSSSEGDRIQFREALDVVGIELFHSLDPSGDGRQAPVPKQLVARLSSQLDKCLASAARAGKKLLVAGVGYASTDGAWRAPHLARGETSAESQEMLYHALMVAVRTRQEESGNAIAGLYLWNWSSFPSAGGLADRGFTPQNKPALDHLPELFRAPE